MTMLSESPILKVRGERFARIKSELGVLAGQVLHLTEFMHPRIQEVVGMLPATIGRFLEARPGLLARADKVVNWPPRSYRYNFLVHGAVALSALKPFRRRFLRHEYEMAHIDRWLTLSKSTAVSDYELAVEILGCRRLKAIQTLRCRNYLVSRTVPVGCGACRRRGYDAQRRAADA